MMITGYVISAGIEDIRYSYWKDTGMPRIITGRYRRGSITPGMDGMHIPRET